VNLDVPGAAQSITYSGHDGRGHPGQIRFRAGSSTVENLVLEYTPLGRVRQVSRVCGTGCTVLVEAYTYDRAGNRKTAEDAAGSRTYHYDAADQLEKITPGLDGSGSPLETFAHDDAGRRTAHAKLSAPASTTSYAYDGHGRLRSLSRTGAAGAYSATLAYGADGRRTRRVEGMATSR